MYTAPMTDFIIVSLVYAVLAWLADKYVPHPIGRIVAVVIVVIWVLRELLPFLGVTI